MKKFFILIVVPIMLGSCAKDSLSDASEMSGKKTIPTEVEDILEAVGDFQDNYQSWLAEDYEPSEDAEIDYDYGVWLVEATLNFNLQVDPEGTTTYVDPSSPFSFIVELNYSMSGEYAYVSESNLMELLDGLLNETSDAAPISNLEITDAPSGGALSISVSGFNVTTVQPSINPLTTSSHRVATKKATCNPSLPDGPSNATPASTDAADRINEAMGPYAFQNPNTPPPGWALVGWYHTIITHSVLQSRNPLALPGSWDWISFYRIVVPGQPDVIMASKTNNQQSSKLWGATEEYNSSVSRNPYECLSGTELMTWKSNAEALAANENVSGKIILSIELEAADYKSGNPNPDHAYHRMKWSNGVYQQYAY